MSALIKSNLHVAVGAVVCVEAAFQGDVKVGTSTVIHPCARILATGGPIVIGEYNIIEERVVIENKSSEPLMIGKFNFFEVGAHVEANAIGDSNTFETRCFVGEGVSVGNGCVFGTASRWVIPGPVEDKSVFFGNPLQTRIASEIPSPVPLKLQIDSLSKILPNYHHIKNPKQTS